MAVHDYVIHNADTDLHASGQDVNGDDLPFYLGKWLVFAYIGTQEYQATVLAYSHDHALDVFYRDNKDAESAEAVLLDGDLSNY